MTNSVIQGNIVVGSLHNMLFFTYSDMLDPYVEIIKEVYHKCTDQEKCNINKKTMESLEVWKEIPFNPLKDSDEYLNHIVTVTKRYQTLPLMILREIDIKLHDVSGIQFAMTSLRGDRLLCADIFKKPSTGISNEAELIVLKKRFQDVITRIIKVGLLFEYIIETTLNQQVVRKNEIDDKVNKTLEALTTGFETVASALKEI